MAVYSFPFGQFLFHHCTMLDDQMSLRVVIVGLGERRDFLIMQMHHAHIQMKNIVSYLHWRMHSSHTCFGTAFLLIVGYSLGNFFIKPFLIAHLAPHPPLHAGGLEMSM